MYKEILGTVGKVGGFAVGGPPGALAGGLALEKIGEKLDKTPEEKQLEAMQKAQFAKLKRGDDLGLSGAQKTQALAGIQKQQMAAQQSAIAEQQRMAAMGGARQGAFFQAQQQQAQQQQDAMAQSRLGVEQQSQAIAEQRKRSMEAMLRQRAMEEQQKRGLRGKEGEMIADERDYGTETLTALEGVKGGDIGLLSRSLG